MGKPSYFVRSVLLFLVACPALLPVRREGLSGAVLCVAASKVGEGDGGFGTRPPPASPSSGSIEGGGEDEEEDDDDEHTAWLSSDLSSTPSMSFSQFPDPPRGSDGGDYEGQDDEIEEGAEANEEEQHEPEEMEEKEEDDSSLEALLSAPVLEDKRAQSSWVHRFCRTPGHEFFCAVPASFLAEEFNWLGLPSDLAAIDLLLGNVVYKGNKGAYKATKDSRPPLPWDEAAARRMYGLIHARFIVTQKGLNAMREKYEQGHFGRCPRLACGGQALLPVGARDGEEEEEEEKEEGHSHGGSKGGVNVYCPRCRELYQPAEPYHQQLNGAYWGTSFAHLFMLAFPDLCPAPALKEESTVGAAASSSSSSNNSSSREKDVYVPRVFGFRVEGREEGREKPRRGLQAGRGAPDLTLAPLQSSIQLKAHDGPPLPPISRNKRFVIKTKLSFWELSHLWPLRRRKERRRIGR